MRARFFCCRFTCFNDDEIYIIDLTDNEECGEMVRHLYKGTRSLSSLAVEKYMAHKDMKAQLTDPTLIESLINEQADLNNDWYEIENYQMKTKVIETRDDGLQVYTINDQESNQKIIYYLHGGGWTFQPTEFHWRFLERLAQKTNSKVIVPLYPKHPNYNFEESYGKILPHFEAVMDTVNNSEDVTVMVDSSGGNMALGLAHHLCENKLAQPKQYILISACVDMHLDHPYIRYFEDKDKMLSVENDQILTEKWANGEPLTNPYLSPLYGNFEDVAPIHHFIGTYDVLYPDSIKFDKKLTKNNIPIDTYVYPEMQHVFPILPVLEARHARKKMYELLLKDEE